MTQYLIPLKQDFRNRRNIAKNRMLLHKEGVHDDGQKTAEIRKIREQEFVDSFDEDMTEAFDDVFEADDTSSYNRYQQMERDRSPGRDELVV